MAPRPHRVNRNFGSYPLPLARPFAPSGPRPLPRGLVWVVPKTLRPCTDTSPRPHTRMVRPPCERIGRASRRRFLATTFRALAAQGPRAACTLTEVKRGSVTPEALLVQVGARIAAPRHLVQQPVVSKRAVRPLVLPRVERMHLGLHTHRKTPQLRRATPEREVATARPPVDTAHRRSLHGEPHDRHRPPVQHHTADLRTALHTRAAPPESLTSYAAQPGSAVRDTSERCRPSAQHTAKNTAVHSV